MGGDRDRPRTTYGGEALSWQLEGGVLEVELHRDPCNEIGLSTLAELEALARLVRAGAGGAHALLWTSAVERGFSAGADLRELRAGLLDASRGPDAWARQVGRVLDRPAHAAVAALGTLRSLAGSLRRGGSLPGLSRAARAWGVRAFLDRIHRAFDTFDRSPIPTVAAVHGVCFGGGFELALTADLIVADRTARFAFPELRLGLIPGFGGIPRLERDLGNAVVRDLLLSGRSLGARRAHEVGLIGQLVGAGEAPRVARRLAEQLGRFDRRTAERAKGFLKPFPARRLEREKDLFCALITSETVERALSRFVASSDPMPYLP
ncbi:MAG: enoyl-CoA hydratase/isomerase family protein [Sandaracinaceae bacterium]